MLPPISPVTDDERPLPVVSPSLQAWFTVDDGSGGAGGLPVVAPCSAFSSGIVKGLSAGALKG